MAQAIEFGSKTNHARFAAMKNSTDGIFQRIRYFTPGADRFAWEYS